MTTHMMIDIETFGTGERAALIQLGCCAFDPEAVVSMGPPGSSPFFEGQGELVGGASQEWNVNLASSLLHGGEIDQGAFKFWAVQSPDKWPAVTANGYTVPFVLDAFDQFWLLHQPEFIWSHGAGFDIVALGSYYRSLRRETPWTYQQPRDTRTLFQLAADLTGWQRPKRAVAHTGKADAIAQAMDVQLAMKALRDGPSPHA